VRVAGAAPRRLALVGILAAGVQMAWAGVPVSAQGVEPSVYEVDGVRVVQSVQPERELVAVRLYLLGGARLLEAETAGVERMVLRASERGTRAFPGNSLREAQVRTGSRFFTSSDPDWSVIGFTGLAEEFARSWEILAERVAHPTLDATAVEVVRQQELTSVRAGSDNPDVAVQRLTESLAFDGHPYAAAVDGTEASLSVLTPEDLRAYHAEHFVKSRLLLSVVGPLDRVAVEEAVRASLASLRQGDYAWDLPEPWPKEEPAVAREVRDLPTTYILGYFAGPRADAEDYPAFQVAVNALSGLIRNAIRARGLSYAAGAPMVELGAAGGSVYVSTVSPYESVGIINDAISMLRSGSIPRAALRDYARDSALDYYLANQTSAQQADFLATSLLLRGRPQSVEDWIETLRDVAGYQVRGAANRYMDNLQFGFLGPGEVPWERILRY